VRSICLIAGVTLPKEAGIKSRCFCLETTDLPVLLTSGYPVREWTARDYFDLQRLGSRSVALLSNHFMLKGQKVTKSSSQLIGAEPSEKYRTA